MRDSSLRRRDFLRSVSLAGAAFSLPALVPATVLGRNPPGSRVTLGLIGMGLMMWMMGKQNMGNQGGRARADKQKFLSPDPLLIARMDITQQAQNQPWLKKLYPKIIPAIARDVIASLMADGDIEVESADS